MRYFLLTFLLTIVLVVGTLGFRGGVSRQPPIEVFPDMDRQPKLRPQEPNRFFADGLSSRPQVQGTVERSEPYENLVLSDIPGPIFPHDDAAVNSGVVAGTTNFVETTPIKVTSQLMERGRERYQIFCTPCHGPLGDGNGVTKKLGMVAVISLHDARIVQMADGQLYNAIVRGSPSQLMGPYAAQIDVPDRWAIVSYVRALQRSRLGTLEDVPEQMRPTLKK